MGGNGGERDAYAAMLAVHRVSAIAQARSNLAGMETEKRAALNFNHPCWNEFTKGLYVTGGREL